jgi:ABC-type xylose transport system permease subunit
LLPAPALLLVIGTIVSPVFLTSGNLNTILTSSAALALVVLAESLVMITGKFDLSLESIYGFAPAIGAMLVVPAAKFGFGFELPTFVGILVVLVVGGLIGFINGFMVVRLRLSAFIVTLAMLIIVRGMLVGATSGRTLFDLPDAFYALMVMTFLGCRWRSGSRRSPSSSPESCSAITAWAGRSTPSAAIRRRPARRASASSGSPGASMCSPASSRPSAGSKSPAMSARSAPIRATA